MYKRLQRPDGSVIILAPKQDTQAITLQVLYKVGSRNETSKINGASHFIEHLMFKGTKKRPTTLALTKALDAVGAEYNAFTSKDRTGYYIKADASHLELAIDVLADMLRHSKFDQAEIDKERGVIVEEIKMYEENPMMYIEDIFEETLFSGTPLGRHIAGPKSVIKSISRQELVDYKDKYYYNGNMVVGLAGRFDEARAAKLLNRYFPLVKKSSAKVVIKPVKLSQSRPRVKLLTKKLDQIQVMLGFPGLKLGHQDLAAATVLANILGGSMSSRLFINVRERRGLCYFIRASLDSHEDTGALAVRAGLDKERLTPALEVIKQELNRIKKTLVTGEELKRAKENIKGSTILRLEDASAYLGYLQAQDLLQNKIETLEEKLAKIQSVSRTDIQRLAKRLINWRLSNLALIGPFKSTAPFYKLLKVK